MDGDSAPLEEIQQVTQQHDGWLMVDDAHGTGVIGEQGRGSCWLQKVKPELLVVTFGKGFGVSGAAVLCYDTVADYLLQFARHLIYSTSMPPAQAQALRASLAVIRSDEGMHGAKNWRHSLLVFVPECRICRLRLLTHAAPSSH